MIVINKCNINDKKHTVIYIAIFIVLGCICIVVDVIVIVNLLFVFGVLWYMLVFVVVEKSKIVEVVECIVLFVVCIACIVDEVVDVGFAVHAVVVATII